VKKEGDREAAQRLIRETEKRSYDSDGAFLFILKE